MGRLDARSITAQMVDVEPVLYGAYPVLERDAMNHSRLIGDVDLAVSRNLVNNAAPYQALVLSIGVGKKSVLKALNVLANWAGRFCSALFAFAVSVAESTIVFCGPPAVTDTAHWSIQKCQFYHFWSHWR